MMNNGVVTRGASVLQLPRISLLVVNELGGIVSFVEIFENSREHLWRFIRKLYASLAIEEVCFDS